MTETERIQRIYDDRAASYDRSLGVVERVAIGPFRREFGSLLGGETLEVAIGSGLNLPYYSERVTRASGVDLSSEMLRQARRRARDLGRPIELCQADAEALPFADATFDTVAISLALCTIPEPVAALEELARVCRLGGRIVMLEHVRSTAPPIALAQRLLTPLNVRAIGCHLDRDTLAIARGLGFRIEEESSRLWGAVRLVVMRPPPPGRATLESVQ